LYFAVVVRTPIALINPVRERIIFARHDEEILIVVELRRFAASWKEIAWAEGG
jgi:hypothetical protein